MTHLKSIIFLILCLALGIGIGKAYIWWNQPKRGFEHSEGPPLITGIGDAPVHRGFAVNAAGLGALGAMLKQGEDVFATAIGIQYDASLTREALVAAVTAAHRQNFTIILLPSPVLSPQNPYPRPLAEIAADAQAADVDILCFSWLGTVPDPAYWREQHRAVRAAYKGQLMLAALPDVLPSVECWDAADLVGAIGPFQLARRLPDAPEDVTLHDMRVAWDCSLTALESLARVNKKRLALLHMDVPAEISACLPSPDAANVAPAKNPALQQMVYEALLLETKGRVEMTDTLLFNWGEAPDADAPNNLPSVLAKVTEAWDPKKPKPAETAPEPAPDDTPVDGTDDTGGN